MVEYNKWHIELGSAVVLHVGGASAGGRGGARVLMTKTASKVPLAKSLAQICEQGVYTCPSCHAPNEVGHLAPLSTGSCSKCGQKFFMPRRINDFYLFEEIGSGGMGSVYKAVSERYPGRTLAVKLLSRQKGENALNVQALLNEARISSLFRDSQYLAACLDHGFDDGEYYTVMNFVEGERLDLLIERLGRVPEAELVALVRHLLAAEQHIWRCGYLYRDMKPENIIVNPEGYAVLFDFGLCLPRRDALNNAGEYITGSPYYLPPERLLGQPEDARSEIYSLGMVMYYALTGRTYYNADEINALAKRHIGGLRIISAAKMEGISKPLADILTAMIQQEPDKRPASFLQLKQELDKLTY